MIVDVLASSSNGNAYIVYDGATSILLDAGIPYKDLQIKSNFKVNYVSACFVSHEHGDHSKAVKDILNAAIDVYALPETLSALGVTNSHRAKIIDENKCIDIKTLKIMPVPLFHDCPCVGYMVYSTKTCERLFFATDTYKITINPVKVNYLILEINYQKEIVNKYVNEGIIEPSIRRRLMYSHFELSNALTWLRRIDRSGLKRIYVAHLSGQNTDAKAVKNAVVSAFGIPTTICEA